MYISAFDLDYTLLSCNGSFSFGKYLYAHKQFSLLNMLYLVSCYARHTIGMTSIQQLHELNFDYLFKGREKHLFESFANRFITEHLNDLIYQPAFKAIQQANQNGHFIIILSSSPDFLVKRIAAKLGVFTAEATVYHTDSNGCFSTLGEIMDGSKKAEILTMHANRLEVSKENLYAYSDSYLDLPFLEASGNPIAVQPSRKLRQISLIKKWTIL